VELVEVVSSVLDVHALESLVPCFVDVIAEQLLVVSVGLLDFSGFFKRTKLDKFNFVDWAFLCGKLFEVEGGFV